MPGVSTRMLEHQFPTVAAMLRDASTDITAFAEFPEAHWRKIWLTNPWSGSTARSNAAPTSSGSSPTPPHLRPDRGYRRRSCRQPDGCGDHPARSRHTR